MEMFPFSPRETTEMAAVGAERFLLSIGGAPGIIAKGRQEFMIKTHYRSPAGPPEWSRTFQTNMVFSEKMSFGEKAHWSSLQPPPRRAFRFDWLQHSKNTRMHGPALTVRLIINMQ